METNVIIEEMDDFKMTQGLFTGCSSSLANFIVACSLFYSVLIRQADRLMQAFATSVKIDCWPEAIPCFASSDIGVL